MNVFNQLLECLLYGLIVYSIGPAIWLISRVVDGENDKNNDSSRSTHR
jgi:hypothetical protein